MNITHSPRKCPVVRVVCCLKSPISFFSIMYGSTTNLFWRILHFNNILSVSFTWQTAVTTHNNTANNTTISWADHIWRAKSFHTEILYNIFVNGLLNKLKKHLCCAATDQDWIRHLPEYWGSIPFSIPSPWWIIRFKRYRLMPMSGSSLAHISLVSFQFVFMGPLKWEEVPTDSNPK